MLPIRLNLGITTKNCEMISAALADGAIVTWEHINSAIYTRKEAVLATLLTGVSSLAAPEYVNRTWSLLSSALLSTRDSEHHHTTRMLLRKGAIPCLKDIQASLYDRDCAAVALLFKHLHRPVDGHMLVMALDASMTPDVLRAALLHGPDPNGCDSYDSRPHLYRALEMGNAAKMRLLLEAGADPNVLAFTFNKVSGLDLTMERLDLLYLLMEYGMTVTEELKTLLINATQLARVNAFSLRPAFLAFVAGSTETGLLPELNALIFSCLVKLSNILNQ